MVGRRSPYWHAPVRCSRTCGWVVLFALAVVLSGCSHQARHEVLIFFFTGVPPLESGQRPAAAVSPVVKADQKAVPSRQGAEAPPKPQQQYYSHPLWKDGSCAACHQVNKLFNFTPGEVRGKRQAPAVFYAGGGMPGPLLSPKDKLCNGCHSDKAGLRAIKEKLWIHNTAAKGDCLACHDAHQSRLSGVLRKPADQLCRSCHPEAKLAGIPMHRQGSESCLSCHNPHLGKDQRLLSQDYREVKQTARRGL